MICDLQNSCGAWTGSAPDLRKNWNWNWHLNLTRIIWELKCIVMLSNMKNKMKGI